MKKNNDGASIILALLYLLICSVLCIVILSASTVISARASERKNTNISKYITVSTLKLFENELSGKVIEYEDDGEIFLERKLENLGIESLSGPLSGMLIHILENDTETEEQLEMSFDSNDYVIEVTAKLSNEYELEIIVTKIKKSVEEMVLPSGHKIKFYPLEYRENKTESKLWIKYGNGEY